MIDQIGWKRNRRIRFHGDHGPLVITLHGGPGATGSTVRLAQGLSRDFRVIEPWQRPSGKIQLTVAVHIQDLRNLILSRCKSEKPALVGSSWGDMLALAYAAEHSETIHGIALVGCGTFDKASRKIIVRKRRLKIADDPHPGPMIRDTLKRYIPHLQYHEFPQCGHDPEIEKYAKDKFFAVLSNWLR